MRGGLVVALCWGIALAGCTNGDSTSAANPDTAASSTTEPSSLSLELSSVRVTGSVAGLTSVGPPPGHPLERIDRDAGISAQLRDGSVVWFFGDTAERDPRGGLLYFEIGSAAWGSPSAPTETLDPDTRSAIGPFAYPTEDFPACPPEADSPGMWPLAAVVRPVGNIDEVLVWMQNICLGSGQTLVTQGISVGRWPYDPAQPPSGQAVTIEILEQNLFPDNDVGDAATLVDSTVYVFGCDGLDRVAGDVLTPCRVARVGVADVADRSAYEQWNGEDWAVGSEPAELLLAEDAVTVGSPPGSVSVMYLPENERWLMGYSPWPGYVPAIALRTADAPEGPWGPAVLVDIPECDDTFRGTAMSCYAANLQPFLTDGDSLGLGWYDQQVSTSPRWGTFRVGQIDYEFVDSDG